MKLQKKILKIKRLRKGESKRKKKREKENTSLSNVSILQKENDLYVSTATVPLVSFVLHFGK